MKTTSIGFIFLISGIICLHADQSTITSPQTGQDQVLPAPTAFRVVDRGADSRIWQRETYEKAPNGHVATIIHKVTELATGMHYKNAQGEWTESQDEIETYAQGAIARQGPYQVIFANNLNSAGAIDLQTPDGERLRSNIVGLMYHDTASGDSVLIAEIQNSNGQLLSSNQVLYPDAFNGVKADVRYTYKKGGFEQDVILREQPPAPSAYGMSPDTTELEVMTEFLNPPQETIQAVDGPSQTGPDQEISWGMMSIGHGKAFDLGEQQNLRLRVSVNKQYVTIQGRKFLLEKVPLKNVQASLQNLPLHAGLKLKHTKTAANKLVLPKPLFAQTTSKPMKLASSLPSGQGYVLDYVLFTSDQNNFTFKSDTTYYLSGEYNLTGATTFEGGTVIKLDSSGQINIDSSGTVVCHTAPYQPAVFTSINDDSVGEIVSGSSGTPATLDLNTYLKLNCATAILSNMRFSYGNYCLLYNTLDLWDCQAVAVDTFVSGQNLGLHNVLLQENPEFYDPPVLGENVTVENATCDGAPRMVGVNDSDGTLFETNCIITEGQYYRTHDDGATYYSVQPIYQTVGAGSYYLATNSPFRNVGTTNISPALLADIATKTTYPPIVYSNTTIVGGTYLPQVQRDTDLPDLGYHYDPLDYCFSKAMLSANLVFTAGTAVGWFDLPIRGGSGNGYGIGAGDSVTVTYAGTFAAPCVQARISTVQEGNGNWVASDGGLLGGIGSVGSSAHNAGLAATVNARFTLFAGLATQSGIGGASTSDIICRFTHCVLNSGRITSYDLDVCLTNCLLLGIWTGAQDDNAVSSAIYMQNCTMREGLMFAHHFGGSTWPTRIQNSAFEGVDFSEMNDSECMDTNISYYDYNAFITNTNRLPIWGMHDVTNFVAFNWQANRLGGYYLPTNSLLIDAGSTSANLLGLYHFTTQTNQIKEANSQVDIGYHYVALDSSGKPVDINGDGTPDFLEDANGNGLVENGETNWALAILTQPAGLSLNQGNNATFSVTAAGVAPLHYQWYFNSTNLLIGATSASLTLTSIQSADTGNYSVVVTNGLGCITSSPALLQVTLIQFDHFCDVSSLQLNGDTIATSNGLDGCVLELTPPVANKWGSVFLKTPVVLGSNSSFSTFFSFRLSVGDIYSSDVDGALGADGFVFVMQTRTNNLVGQGGGFMGYGDKPPNGAFTNCSVGVEFDTHYNDNDSYNGIYDPADDGNHIGIDTNSCMNSLVTQHVTDLFNNTNIWYVWIDYDGTSSNLQIRASETNSRPTTPTLTNTINLSQYWGSTNVYVGFSAGAGYYNQQDILSWEFSVGSQRVVDTNISVTILSPVNQTFLTRTDVPVTAVVSNSTPSTPANWVEFFAGTNSLGGVVSTNNEYVVNWSPSIAGTNILIARARNTNGLVVWSQPVTNYVKSQPSINLTNPVDGALYLKASTNLVLQALAVTDASTTITNVIFYSGTNAIGTNRIGVANLYAFTNNFTNGIYVLRARAFDGNGGSSYSSNATITVTTNQPPSVYAGPDQTVNLLMTNALILNGLTLDDGLPAGVLTTVWSCPNGSTNVSFLNSNRSTTIVYFGAPGVYTLWLSANDSEFIRSNSLTITVISNTPPFAYAGPDQTHVNQLLVQLHGAIADDGQPNGTLISSWSVVSGPGQVYFAQADLTNTIATFSLIGTYQLKLTASEGQLMSSSNVTLTLVESNAMPYQATNYLYLFDPGTNPNTTNFAAIDYDDSFWTNGQAGFGSIDNGNACLVFHTNYISTFWPGQSVAPYAPYLLLRRHFNVPVGTTNLSIQFMVDNGAQIFINGFFVAPDKVDLNNGGLDLDGYYHSMGCLLETPWNLEGIHTNIWHIGDNLLAVRVFDSGGVCFFDSKIFLNSLVIPSETVNQPPTIAVNQTNFWTTNTVSLIGWVSDDGLPSLHGTAQWVDISGPGTVTYSNDPAYPYGIGYNMVGDRKADFSTFAELKTSESFSMPGNYTLCFIADDGTYSVTNYVTVLVASPGIAPPTVSLGLLAGGTNFGYGAAVPLEASANATAGTITNVQIFALTANGTFLASAAAENPLTVNWLPPTPGPVAFFAVTTDSGGRVGYSDPVDINVETNHLPVVAVNQDFFWTTNSIQLRGWVLDDGLPSSSNAVVMWTNVNGSGTVTFTPASPVAGFTNFLELDATATFSASGNYLLRFLASDGEFTVSNDVTVVVAVPTVSRPVVNLVTPSHAATFASGSLVPLLATATTGAGTVTNVDFFALTLSGKTFLGRNTNSPFTLNWTPPLPGTYSFLAVATDTGGRVGDSTVVNIHVTAFQPPVAMDDVCTVLANSINNTLDVLTNDFSTNTGSLRIISYTPPKHGGNARIINGGTAVSYTPPHKVRSAGPDLTEMGFGDTFSYDIVDGKGGTATGYVNVVIFGPDAPQVTLTPQAPVNAGTVVPLIAYVSPSLYITNVEFYLGAALLGTVTNGQNGLFTNFWTASAKDCDCGFTATAYDSFGQIGTSPEIHITVHPPLNSLDGMSSIGPVATFANYTAGTNAAQPFTNQVTIRDGVISISSEVYHPLGSNDVVWQLGVYSQDGQTLIRNLTPPPFTNTDYPEYHAGKIGASNAPAILTTNCDLTTLQNGVYLMRLVAIGGYMITNVDLQFILDSNLKIGQFSFSQQDLVIPVNGIPLTVTRTYNSLNPDKGDFGNSWTYALNDMDVQLDETRTELTLGGDTINFDEDHDGGEPAHYISMRYNGGRDVTLTLPDGRRTTFYAALVPAGGDGGGLMNNLVWNPEPGVTATLKTPHPAPGDGSAGDNTLDGLFGFTAYWDAAGPGSYDNYDFPEWILTTHDGTRYHITRGEQQLITYEDPENIIPNPTAIVSGPPKLTKIEQRTGDIITIADDGITYQNATNGAARKILFHRNDRGFIDAITDPTGQTNGGPAAVKYEYDSYDNLMSVERLVDRSGAGSYATNSFLYTNPKFPHYITQMINGDGTTVAQNFYDDSGKLTAVVDANGKLTQFSHNSTNKIEMVTDRVGRMSTYVYDLRGNVILETNALGQATVNAYYDNNNLRSTTDPLQHTTSYTYDDFNNRKTMVDPLGHTNFFDYDSNDNLTSQTDPLGNSTTNKYDTKGELTDTAQYDPQGNLIQESSTIYDNGQVFQTKNAREQTTASFAYDPSSGYLSGTTDARGFTRNFGYDDNGNQTSSSYVWTNASGTPITVTTASIYDAQGRATMTIDADGNTNQTIYDLNGKVSSTIDKFGNTSSSIYDARGNVIQSTMADGTFTRTVYDDNGQPFLTSDRNQVTGTLMQYDALGRATNTIRLTGLVINLVADPLSPGQQASVIGSPGTGYSTNSTVYMVNGWVASRTGSDGKTTTYEYYDDGQVKQTVDPLGHTNSFAYDEAGRQTNMVDALSRTIQSRYDAVGRQVATVYANNSTRTNIFNDLGQRTGAGDQAGLLTQFGYDTSGQLTNVIKPAVYDPESSLSAAPAWVYQYDLYGRITVSTDPKGRTNTFTYDALGRQLTHRLPLGQVETNGYTTTGVKGLLWKQYDFKGQRTEYVYDHLGRVRAKFLFAVGAATPSNAVCYIYNPLGQLSELVERYGSDATTNACDGYTALVGPPEGGSHGLLACLAEMPPQTAGGFTGVILLALAMAAIPRTKRRQLVECIHEAWLNHRPDLKLTNLRLARKRLHMPSRGWRWVTPVVLATLIANEPGMDRLWTAHAEYSYPSNSSTETTRYTYFTYDNDNHLTQVNAPEGVINYGYDLATGRHLETNTQNTDVQYGYDELGRLKTVTVIKRNGTTLTTPEVTTYAYDAVGNRSSLTLPNGVVTTYAYDSLNRMTNLVHQLGTTNLATYVYKVDQTGRRTNAVETLRQEDGTYQTNVLSWRYDGLYRLTNEVSVTQWTSGGIGYTNSFIYDLNGNRLHQLRTGSGAETVDYTYDKNDELTTESNGSTTTYLYDANGSLTNRASAGGAMNYTYNVANKMVGVYTNSTLLASYLYNEQGIRVSTTSGGTTNHFLIDANNHTGYAQVLEELNALNATPTTSYVLGDETLAQCGTTATAPTYFLQDGHGSNRQLAQMSGQIAQHYSYDAYGSVQTSTSSSTAESATTTKLYCGEQYDTNLHMYNLRARYYDPSNGRFNQRDAFEGLNDDPQSLHKYLYANCDPINGLDPSGNGELLNLLTAISIIIAIVSFPVHIWNRQYGLALLDIVGAFAGLFGLFSKMLPPALQLAGLSSTAAAAGMTAEQLLQGISAVIAGTDLMMAMSSSKHHVLTNKNDTSTAPNGEGPFTPKFKELLDGTGITLDDDLNIVDVLNHSGPHPEANKYVYDAMLKAAQGLTKGTSAYRDAMLDIIKKLGKECATPGTTLNNLITTRS